MKAAVLLNGDTDQLEVVDDITVLDHGLTRPWTVNKTYRRNANPRPIWIEYVCAEGQQLVHIGDRGVSNG